MGGEVNPNETYLSPQELVERWKHRVQEQTLRMWRTRGRKRGPAYIKVGQRVLYPLKDLELWEKSMTSVPGLKLGDTK